MGHTRLGRLPRTRKWQQVVGLIGGGADTPEIAAATLDASKRGLVEADQDPGLVYSVWLLTQIPLAAREKDFGSGLRRTGLEVSGNPTLLEIVGAFTKAVDEHLGKHGGRTDLGEIAQLAAAECLTALGAERSRSLFGTTPEDVQRAFRGLSTTKNFGLLSKEFFARLSRRYLNYFLSRELSNHVGRNGRFSNIDQHTEFQDALAIHCTQAARIVEDFSGGWFSKANFEGGITHRETARFVHAALKKLRNEFAMGAAASG